MSKRCASSPREAFTQAYIHCKVNKIFRNKNIFVSKYRFFLLFNEINDAYHSFHVI